jgi:4-amino-4-deoxy-L-arabinose transferase-like glycosyltransferase
MAALQAARVVAAAIAGGHAALVTAGRVGYVLVAAAALAALPSRLLDRATLGLEPWLCRPGRSGLLLATALFLLVLPLLGTTHVSKDEVGCYRASRLVAVEGTGALLEHYVELPWLGERHPPLTPLVYGVALRLFGDDTATNRGICLAFGLLTVLGTLRLAAEGAARSERIAAALLLCTMPLFLRQSVMANNDMPLTFCFCWTVALAAPWASRSTAARSLGAALALGAGWLTKYTIAFVYPLLLPHVLGLTGLARDRRKQLLWILLGGLGFLALWLVIAAESGILKAQWVTLSGHAGVAHLEGPEGWSSSAFSAWRNGQRLRLIGLALPRGIAAYLLPLIALGMVAARDRTAERPRFALWWVAVVVLPVVVIFPELRFCLPAFPALAVLAAHGAARVPGLSGRAVPLAIACALEETAHWL